MIGVQLEADLKTTVAKMEEVKTMVETMVPEYRNQYSGNDFPVFVTKMWKSLENQYFGNDFGFFVTKSLPHTKHTKGLPHRETALQNMLTNYQYRFTDLPSLL